MKVKLTALDARLLKTTKKIAALADKKGISLYLVGGIVRDLILKKKNFDLDFIVKGDAIFLAREAAKKLKAQVITHPRFNTATLVCADGFKIDMAMSRSEKYVTPGALPVVSPAGIHDDLFRRDFTINAMAIAVNKESFGELVDVYNGMNDVRERKIRILHEQSFMDDPTRILRAIRFEKRFDFSFERQTLAALKSALKQGALKRVTHQRFFHEFYNLLKEPRPLKYIKRMDQVKAFDHFAKGYRPDFRLLNIIEKNMIDLPQRHGYDDVDDGLVYLMGMAASMSPAPFKKLINSFGLTKHQIEGLQSLKKIKRIISKLNQKELTPSEAYSVLKSLPITSVGFMRVFFTSRLLLSRLDFYMGESRFMELAINGKVLQGMGLASDKSMGEILKELLRRKVDGQLCGSQAEMKMAECLVSELVQQTNRGI